MECWRRQWVKLTIVGLRETVTIIFVPSWFHKIFTLITTWTISCLLYLQVFSNIMSLSMNSFLISPNYCQLISRLKRIINRCCLVWRLEKYSYKCLSKTIILLIGVDSWTAIGKMNKEFSVQVFCARIAALGLVNWYTSLPIFILLADVMILGSSSPG